MVIKLNAHKVSALALYKNLKVNRSVYYYRSTVTEVQTDMVEKEVVRIFNENEKVYGTRKIKIELKKVELLVSRRRIGRIMRLIALVSS